MRGVLMFLGVLAILLGLAFAVSVSLESVEQAIIYGLWGLGASIPMFVMAEVLRYLEEITSALRRDESRR